MTAVRTTLAALILVAVSPIAARADTMLIPFFGVNFGGDSGKNLGGAFDAKRFNWGTSLTLMGAGVFGVEGDISYSPDFFGKTDVGGSSVLTGTGNLVAGVPFGGQRGFGVRPYGLVGFGVMHSEGDFSSGYGVDDNSATWSAGGGLMVFFGTNVGLRFDLRYFRTFDDLEVFGVTLADSPGKVDFTRATTGLVVRF